jgi:hypothetical protein
MALSMRLAGGADCEDTSATLLKAGPRLAGATMTAPVESFDLLGLQSQEVQTFIEHGRNNSGISGISARPKPERPFGAICW